MISFLFQNHYERLQLPRDAGDKEIQQAFRRLALRYHPDVADDKEMGHKMFLLLKEAHETLSDPQKRRDYDQLLAASDRFKAKRKPRPAPQSGARTSRPRRPSTAGNAPPPPRARHTRQPKQPDASGFTRPPPQAGSSASRQQPRPDLDLQAQLEISLEDALHGATHTVTLEDEPAPNEVHWHAFSAFSVTIPPATWQGRQLTIPYRGARDPKTGQRGSLLLTIELARHPTFRVLGKDLYASTEIYPWDAATGTLLHVPTLDGDAALTIPAGAQPWQSFRLQGQGLPTENGSRGNLFLTLKFRAPKAVTPQQKQLWNQLRQAYHNAP